MQEIVNKLGGGQHKGYIIGGGGGGGSSINFAIIQVSYPENDKKPSVYLEGKKIGTAPDLSGLWLCGVPETGTYTVTYGTANPITVAIVSKAQVSSIYISEQVTNCKPIFLLGNTFEEETGGFEVLGNNAQSGYSGNYKYYHTEGIFLTRNIIDFRNFTKIYTIMSGSISPDELNLYTRVKIGFGRKDTFYNIDFPTQVAEYSNPTSIAKYFNNITGTREIVGVSSYSYSACNYNNTYSYGNSVGGTINHYTYEQARMSGVTRTSVDIRALIICREDDLSIISEYGSTATEILNNSNLLFEDRIALQKMVQNISGEFMLTALANATFRNAYNASPNKDIIQNNAEWSKYLGLMSI